MKLFRVSQTVNDNYETYDSIIVAAKNEHDAREVKKLDDANYSFGAWVKDVADLSVEEIGTAKRGTKRGIIHESFNAA